MKLLALASTAILLAALAQGGKKEPPPTILTEPTPLPGPERAALAAQNVSPALKRDLATLHLYFGDPVFLRAFKDEKRLELFVRDRSSGKFRLFRSYAVAAASGVPGPKCAEGDAQVPEGFYYVTPDRMKPDSQFHLAFNIGYPNEYDRAHGRTGTAIMVHGNQVSIGCLAMTDRVIEEIYTLCDAALVHGQPFFRIHIFPFRLSADRLQSVTNGEFWQNLKEGYDFFETRGVPPNVTVADGRYLFTPPDRVN